MTDCTEVDFKMFCFIFILMLYLAKECFCIVHKEIEKKPHYEPYWDSLETRPLPDWFDEAKIGVFIHWGVYSVPSVTSEWFWFDWKIPEHNPALHGIIMEFMKNNYQPGFTYQDFAKEFTAEFFNATEWLELFGKSGVKYVVLTSKHHDGYALWPSKYSFSWNSADVGPHRDLVGELANATRLSKHGIKFGLYHSLFEWFHPQYNSDKSKNFSTQEFVNYKIFPEMVELVERYKPEVFWSDGEEEAPSNYWRSEEFIAWLYNDSPVSNTVLVNDRWGKGTACKHGGYFSCYDRYTPGKLQKRKWENAMTLDRSTWGYSRRSNLIDYLTTQELIDLLVETVAYGGNLLVNIGPAKDGKIAPIFQERLLDMGDWLSKNGEAVYKSKPWEHCQNDKTTSSVWYTKGSKNILYAILLRWPKSGVIYLSCPELNCDSKIVLLSEPSHNVDWTINQAQLLKIGLPNKSEVKGNWAWTLKITNPLN